MTGPGASTTRQGGEVRPCANGCTTNGNPRRIDAPRWICNYCEDTLARWLSQIPDTYALLPTFIEHGSTERNPDSVATKASVAPAPMRLEIIDLLDTRHGRKWLGTNVAPDRRGVVGVLLAIASEIVDQRQLTIPPKPTVTDLAEFIARHLDWLTCQDWVTEPWREIKMLDRQLSDAVGDYRPKPVGTCHNLTDRDEPCGGPLLANPYGGVKCPRCGATWDANHLRQLGLAQAAQETG